MTHPARQAIVRWAAAVLLTLVVLSYPLSYAPVVRWKTTAYTYNPFFPIDGESLPVYQPIDWLIDNTALNKPLFIWARLWGVEDEFHFSAHVRDNYPRS